MCRVKSMMTASPTACPARALPPPRGSTGDAILARDLMHGDHIIGVAREGDRQRHDLIIAGVGAVEQARHAVGGRLVMPDGAPQIMQHLVNLHGQILYPQCSISA